MRIWASRQQWQAFLRRCKAAYPNEHCEAVWGEETVDSFRVVRMVRMRLNKATSKLIDYDDIEIKRQKWAAEQEGLKFLGTVHTHPGKDLDSAPSAFDHHACAACERIMGIVNLYKAADGRRYAVETNWWFPQRKIEFDLDDSL